MALGIHFAIQSILQVFKLFYIWSDFFKFSLKWGKEKWFLGLKWDQGFEAWDAHPLPKI